MSWCNVSLELQPRPGFAMFVVQFALSIELLAAINSKSRVKSLVFAKARASIAR